MKLENAITDLENGDIAGAIDKLTAFINSVEAQRGKKIPVAEGRCVDRRRAGPADGASGLSHVSGIVGRARGRPDHVPVDDHSVEGTGDPSAVDRELAVHEDVVDPHGWASGLQNPSRGSWTRW